MNNLLQLPRSGIYWFWFIFLSWFCATCSLSTENLIPVKASPLPASLVAEYLQARETNVDAALTYADSIINYIEKNQLPDSLHIYYLFEKAETLVKAGRQKEALNFFLEGNLLASLSQDSTQMALAALQLGNYYNIIYQPALALPYTTQAAQYYKNYPSSPETAKTLSNLGRAYLEDGNSYKALELFNQVAQIHESNKDSLNIAYNLSDIGYALIQLQQEEAGLDATRKGIQIVEALKNAPDVGMTLSNLALNYRDFHPDTAILYQQKAMELTLELGDSLNWIASKFNFGNVLYEFENYPDAKRVYQEVLAFCQEKQIDHGVMLSFNALGTLHHKTGQQQEAISLLQKANRMITENSGSTAILIQNLQSIGMAQRALGNIESAQTIEWKVDSLQRQSKSQQIQSSLEYLEQNMEVGQALFNQQMLEKQSAEAKAQLIRRNVILGLILSFVIAGLLLWYRWRVEYQSGQQAINRLLNKYARELEKEKSNESNPPVEVHYAKLSQELVNLLEIEKIYLQSNLKTEDVQERLQISYKDLNHILKSQFQTSFPNLVNQYRIKTAQQLLADPDHANLSMDEIAILSGFGTRQNFYKTFQLIAGVSPGSFRAYFQENWPQHSG